MGTVLSSGNVVVENSEDITMPGKVGKVERKPDGEVVRCWDIYREELKRNADGEWADAQGFLMEKGWEAGPAAPKPLVNYTQQVAWAMEDGYDCDGSGHPIDFEGKKVLRSESGDWAYAPDDDPPI